MKTRTIKLVFKVEDSITAKALRQLLLRAIHDDDTDAYNSLTDNVIDILPIEEEKTEDIEDESEEDDENNDENKLEDED
jgi:hypothetical protein